VRRAALLLVALLAAACDRAAEGSRAYGEGRFKDAVAAYGTAVQAAGDHASAELLYDASLAALRTGDWSAADAAAERAARRDARFAALATFVRGYAAFGRAELAARQASGPEAEPFAIDVAIGYADAARKLWQTAAMDRDDWPAARRNAERALLLIEKLKSKRKPPDARPSPQANPKSLPGIDPKKPPDVRPPSADDGSKGTPQGDPAARSAVAESDLAPGEVPRLLDLLAERERRKQAARREQREARAGEVEKDW